MRKGSIWPQMSLDTVSCVGVWSLAVRKWDKWGLFFVLVP